MKKQYYPLLSYLAIAAFLFGTPLSSYAQVFAKKAKSTLSCNSAPLIHCPPNYNACPGASIDPNVSQSATAAPGGPDCGIPLVSHIDNIIKTGNCPGAKLVQRVWIAQDPDDPNLKGFCIQYLSTLDTTAPVFSNCPRDTAILSNSNCTSQFKWTMPWVSDVCGNFSVTSSHFNGGDFAIGHHQIVITATDVCGNSSSCSFHLEVISNCCTAPPKIICPSNYFSCPGGSIDPSVTGKPLVQKSSANCKDPIISFTDKFYENINCTLNFERTWIAQDPDNLQSLATCVQKIKLQDTIPPVFTSKPSNITVSSDDNCMAVVTWKELTATDNCGPVIITSTVPSGWQFTLGVSAVAVVATDACGNTSKCEFLVTVEDNCCHTAPVINCPADYLGCPGSSLDPAITGNASASPGTPHCKIPKLRFSDQFVKSTDCETELIRTWKATDPDKSNLFSTCIQKIKLEDKIPPVFTFCPLDVTVQSGINCNAIVFWNAPVAIDNCTNVNITTSIPNGSVFQIGQTSVTVTATDVCGNSSSCQFNITVTENCCKLPPILNCPPDFKGCPSSDLDPITTGQATALPGDIHCPQPILSYLDIPVKYISCYLELNRTWTATDPQHPNLSTSCIQKIILKDDVPPVITFCPPNITVQSNENCMAIVSWNAPVATDNCGIPAVTTSIPSGFEFTLGVTGVVVIATDACGNTSKCEFIITVEANCCQHSPVLNCPPDFVGCPSTDLNPNVTGKATAQPGDANCMQPVLSFKDDTIQSTNCLLELNRTWTANTPLYPLLTTACIQKITLKDDVPPVITFCPPNITVQSNDDCVAVVNWNAPVAIDNCGATSIAISKQSGFRFQIGITNVFVIASDACGNQSACAFQVTVQENCCNNAPAILCPPDYFTCPGSSVDISVTGKATADPLRPICQQPIITFTDNIISSDPCRYIIQRVWTAINPKNNAQTICTQSIVQQDPVSPEFLSCPTDVTVDPQYNCDAVVNWNLPVATDNCGLKSLLSTHQPGSSFSKGITKVVYTATDNCGNTSSCLFFITVTERCCDKNPVIHCPPDYTSCPGPGIDPTITGKATAEPGKSDCQKPLISYSDRIITSGPCPGAIKIERSWIAVDPDISTLRTECKQIIDIKDTEPPHIQNMPADITINAKGSCDAPAFWIQPIAVDNCGLSSLSFDHKPGSRFTEGTTYVVYTAVDLCGLVTKDSFKITVRGTEVGILCPDDTSVIRTDPFINGAFVDWTTPKAKHCNPCRDNIPGYIYMGELDGHRYFCSAGLANWTNARFICEQLGGHLAVINSEKENKFLASKLNGQTAWLGGTDERKEGEFEWIDNSPFAYTSWSPGQPNDAGGNEDYIELLPDGTWNDQNGNFSREYICEISCYELTQIGGAIQGDMLPCGKNKISYAVQKDGISDTCSFFITVDCDKESIYCKTKGLNSKYMFINRVEFAGIDTITGDNGGYKYFNKACGAITQGQSYPICLTPGFLNTTYKVYWKIWIDFNADGFFDPVTEEVVYGYGTTTLCANLTMPPSLPSKQTRMRVIMSYSGYPASPCNSPLFGEVEDYCILMNGASAFVPENEPKLFKYNPVQLHCVANCENNEKTIGEFNSANELDLRNQNKTLFEADLYPNPSSNQVSVFSKTYNLADYEIFDHHGKMVLRSADRKSGSEFSFSVVEWPSGIYTIILYNSKGEQLIKRFMINH